MATNWQMRVALFAGWHLSPGAEPVWTGPFADFYDANPDYSIADMDLIASEISTPGGRHLIGGGAAGTFTLKRAEG